MDYETMKGVGEFVGFTLIFSAAGTLATIGALYTAIKLSESPTYNNLIKYGRDSKFGRWLNGNEPEDNKDYRH